MTGIDPRDHSVVAEGHDLLGCDGALASPPQHLICAVVSLPLRLAIRPLIV